MKQSRNENFEMEFTFGCIFLVTILGSMHIKHRVDCMLPTETPIASTSQALSVNTQDLSHVVGHGEDSEMSSVDDVDSVMGSNTPTRTHLVRHGTTRSPQSLPPSPAVYFKLRDIPGFPPTQTLTHAEERELYYYMNHFLNDRS